ncbi:MAG: hypothetical protein EOP49_24095 [Sphingobacteriales bacterium]|nr:MAG: hypothetical protein EOP49_24095 [Sphingobacteriales bacterium]
MAIINGSRVGGKRKGAGRPRTNKIPKNTFTYWAARPDVDVVTEEYGSVGKLVEMIASEIRKKRMLASFQRMTKGMKPPSAGSL